MMLYKVEKGGGCFRGPFFFKVLAFCKQTNAGLDLVNNNRIFGSGFPVRDKACPSPRTGVLKVRQL
eukprot:scaffold2157_cov111-Cylindrotheca_fusiformis.AAC.1